MNARLQDSLLEFRNQHYSKFVKDIEKNGRKNEYSDGMSFTELDEWRTTTLSKTLHQRYKDTGILWLEKTELAKLMEWKLARGKFRATLEKLIQSNDPDSVKSFTDAAFQVLVDWTKSRSDASEPFPIVVRKAMDHACKLRGVGPATATLILSLSGPALRMSDLGAHDVPFFSDEVFEILNPSYGKIKYTAKEYIDLVLSKMAVFDAAKLQNVEEALWCLRKTEKIGKPSKSVEKLLDELRRTIALAPSEEKPSVKRRKIQS
ncbi:hypothetical protein OGAPHI_000421 [Ogataea philodendri]|uniref:Uncharacterized protein n=1 Tax=Ogataea philodendri TaxID=1378263 RepID=A0A9P8TAB6_9ASCO|nr:uncharacterized protein OGAPHI_000421 [Ogataea philodendri]KAH3671716.1 hypothetical protein OGAPHI_000421 [Ogataea philodendri]